MLKKNKNDYDKISTLLGEDIIIDGGTVKANETMRIDGQINGSIESEGNIFVGEKGRINGNIQAINILIAGKVEGNLSAKEQIHLTSSSQLLGDMKCNSFVVDEGAIFQGKCDMKTPTVIQGSKSNGKTSATA